MADRPFPYDDFEGMSREIDRLWSKLGPATPVDLEPPAPPPSAEQSSPSRQMAWEAVSLLKRQHRTESRSWREMLEARDQAVQALKARLSALESDNAALRDRLRGEGSRLLEEGLEAQAQLETSLKALEEERRQREHESSALRGLLEQTRQRLAAEDARWKAQQREWDKKEQQYLIDLRDLQALVSRHQEEAARSGDESRRLSDSVREAKNALEKTLAEFLRERQAREQVEQERAQALKKVDDTQKHLQELSKLWDEERAQWRELWDRERSTWEAQRQEFSSWEQRLREERQKWHADLEAKEKDQLRFTDEMTQALRQTAELSSRVTTALRPPPPKPRRSPWLPAAAAAVALLAAVSPFAWRYATRRHFKLEATQSLASTANPTALGFDGTLVWVGTWDGRLIGYDPQNVEASVRSAAPAELAPYRPAAMAFGNGFVWTLDAAQARVVRQSASDPGRVLSARPSPGPAPTALAFDGQALWSYDAANRSLYKHGSDESQTKAYALDPDLVVTAMAWVDGDLWAFDAKGRRLVDYAFKNDAFKRRESYKFDEPILALVAASGLVDGRRRPQLWALAGPSGARQTAAFLRYDY